MKHLRKWNNPAAEYRKLVAIRKHVGKSRAAPPQATVGMSASSHARNIAAWYEAEPVEYMDVEDAPTVVETITADSTDSADSAAHKVTLPVTPAPAAAPVQKPGSTSSDETAPFSFLTPEHKPTDTPRIIRNTFTSAMKIAKTLSITTANTADDIVNMAMEHARSSITAILPDGTVFKEADAKEDAKVDEDAQEGAKEDEVVHVDG